MPNKPKLKEFFPVRAIEFALAYRTGAAAGRPDEIGAPREAAVRNLLKSILPPSIGVTKGHIIYKKMVENSVELEISSEFDIILYDKQLSRVPLECVQRPDCLAI